MCAPTCPLGGRLLWVAAGGGHLPCTCASWQPCVPFLVLQAVTRGPPGLPVLPGDVPAAALPTAAAAEDFSTRFAGQVKSLDCEGYVLKKWEKRIDVTMK